MMFLTLLHLSGTLVCSSNGTGSSSIYSVAMVAIPDCVDNATQTDISFQNIVTLGKSRGHHHHHHGRGGGSSSPPPPPPSPPLPHLVGPYGINELYVLTCCLSVSRHEKSIMLDMMGIDCSSLLPPAVSLSTTTPTITSTSRTTRWTDRMTWSTR